MQDLAWFQIGTERHLATLDLSHLAWPKAALLVLIRGSETEHHPNHKRTIRRSEDGDQYDFVLHASTKASAEDAVRREHLDRCTTNLQFDLGTTDGDFT